jgi:hypothetical protein
MRLRAALGGLVLTAACCPVIDLDDAGPRLDSIEIQERRMFHYSPGIGSGQKPRELALLDGLQNLGRQLGLHPPASVRQFLERQGACLVHVLQSPQCLLLRVEKLPFVTLAPRVADCAVFCASARPFGLQG